jgi:two-component system LytT family response regulator
MTKINTLLVDDEQEALDSLEILLNEYSNINILKKISNPLDVFRYLMQHKVDLIFLDINMAQISGIELLNKIREFAPLLAVIFVTAHKEHVRKAVQNHAFGYLLKPVNRIELKTTLGKVQNYIQSINTESIDRILINSNGKSTFVDIKQVAYLQAEGNYTHIFLHDGSRILATYNIGTLIHKFPEKEFVRINRSQIVNEKKIISVSRKQKICTISFKNEEKDLSASVSFLRKFNSIFSND